MHHRHNALQQWLKSILEPAAFTITPLAGDASFRRYFRIHTASHSYVLMDAPPEKETITPFMHIGKALAAIGIHTPAIHAYEAAQGFLLIANYHSLQPKNRCYRIRLPGFVMKSVINRRYLCTVITMRVI
jgi:aminoglycoside/choline kinase family phosphotransferase